MLSIWWHTDISFYFSWHSTSNKDRIILTSTYIIKHESIHSKSLYPCLPMLDKSIQHRLSEEVLKTSTGHSKNIPMFPEHPKDAFYILWMSKNISTDLQDLTEDIQKILWCPLNILWIFPGCAYLDKRHPSGILHPKSKHPKKRFLSFE